MTGCVLLFTLIVVTALRFSALARTPLAIMSSMPYNEKYKRCDQMTQNALHTAEQMSEREMERRREIEYFDDQ